MHTASHPIEMKAIPPPAPSARRRPHGAAARALRYQAQVRAPSRRTCACPASGRFERRLRGAWKLDWAARHPHGAGRAVLRCHHHVARERVWMRQRSRDAEHRRMRNVELAQPLFPIRHRMQGDCIPDLSVDFVAVLAAPNGVFSRSSAARSGRSIASQTLNQNWSVSAATMMLPSMPDSCCKVLHSDARSRPAAGRCP